MSTPLTFPQICMDCRMLLTGVYNAGTGKTTFTFPVTAFPTFAVQLSTGLALPITLTGDTTGTVTGDFSSGQCVLGVYSPVQVDLSEVVSRGEGDRPEIDYAILLRHVTVLHKTAGGFSVQVASANPTQYPTFSLAFAPDLTLPAAYPLTTTLGRLRVRVGMVAERTTVSIIESTWKPVQVYGLEHDIELMEGPR